jgi:hypothetical protein
MAEREGLTRTIPGARPAGAFGVQIGCPADLSNPSLMNFPVGNLILVAQVGPVFVKPLLHMPRKSAGCFDTCFY